MISTRDLTQLPPPADLQRLLQALAMLDAIMEEEWEYRYYSFNANWAEGEQLGSMRNGEGDDFFAVFDAAGCFLRGFDHESVMSPWSAEPAGVWPGVLDQVPPQFQRAATEPAFHMEDTTFCIWFNAGDTVWSRGDIAFPLDEVDPDGSEWMLALLDGNPDTYREFSEEYYEEALALDAIRRVYEHEPLSAELLSAFPSPRDLAGLIADAEEIGYPVARED
jgi:hypothetical protein